MKPLRKGDLTIEPMALGRRDRICLVFRGKSSERSPGVFLGPYFGELLQAASDRGATIELRFEHLEHLNSSTITVLIQFLQETSSCQVPVLLSYDDAVEWQRISFDALGVFAGDDGLVTLLAASPEIRT